MALSSDKCLDTSNHGNGDATASLNARLADSAANFLGQFQLLSRSQ
jgi:hypothetical protein